MPSMFPLPFPDNLPEGRANLSSDRSAFYGVRIKPEPIAVYVQLVIRIENWLLFASWLNRIAGGKAVCWAFSLQ